MLAVTLVACQPGPPKPAMAARAEAPAPEAIPDDATKGNEAPASEAAAPAMPSEPAAPVNSSEPAPPHAGLPTECYTQGELCLPPPDFVDRLCRAAHVGTAIRLFAKSSPFTRAYVRMREVRALNLRGGPSSDVSLTFAEEVLLLAQHGGSGEMLVSGEGGFDVLRWDGTCATLSSDELVRRVPAPPRHAPFAWKYIDDAIQRALLQNDTVRSARAAERQRCHGSSDAALSASCRDAAERLNDRIFLAIHSGVELPVPDYTP